MSFILMQTLLIVYFKETNLEMYQNSLGIAYGVAF
jgi:hypothetical protein